MFVLSRDVSAAKRVIATLLATAIVLWASGAFSSARAANITDVRDLITDSAPAASADHQIEFTMSDTGTVANNGGVIDIAFPDAASDFDLSALVATDVEIEVNTVNVDSAWDVTFPDAFTIRLTGNNTGGDIVASDDVIIYVGTNAVGGANQIANPTPVGGNESFEIDISAGTDSGHMRVVILDTVLVTATVNTSFEFTVTGLDNGVAVNGATTNATSSSTTIPFGTLQADTPVILAQDLQVQTNAINGFVVTVESDGDLRSSTGADIDVYKDGVLITDPETWESVATTLDINNEKTWGYWGITTEDATTTRSDPEFGSNEWAGVTTTPTIIYSHDGPADSSTPGIGSTTVGYKVEISALQEAADDYSTTLTYIATPTF